MNKNKGHMNRYIGSLFRTSEPVTMILTHLNGEFESFKKGILKVENYLFTFLTNLHVPYDNNASERGVRKIKIKQKVSGCFRTDGGADDFAKLHSIAETAMKNGNSKFNAILAVVKQ